MKTAIAYLIALTALIFSIFDDLPEKIATSVFGSTELLDESPGFLSFYEVLSNRKDLTGQRVFTSGVLSFVDGEYPTLFVNLESAQRSILQNGIQIWSFEDHCQIDLAPYAETYVTIWAKLSKDGRWLLNVDQISLNSTSEELSENRTICNRHMTPQETGG